jgi:hypothetical protein
MNSPIPGLKSETWGTHPVLIEISKSRDLGISLEPGRASDAVESRPRRMPCFAQLRVVEFPQQLPVPWIWNTYEGN